MNRKGFLKSIAMLAVAPKIIAEMEFKPPIKAVGPTAGLVNSLQLLTPKYYEAFVEKYGTVDYVSLMEEMNKNKVPVDNNQYFWFEKRNSES